MSDRHAIDELRRAAGGDRETVVLHYVYFPTENAAQAAAAKLKGVDWPWNHGSVRTV